MSGAITRVGLEWLFNRLGLPVLVMEMAVAPCWLAFYCVPLDGAQASDLSGAVGPLAEAVGVSVTMWRREAGVGILVHLGRE